MEPLTLMTELKGRMMGRNERECTHMGVIMMQGMLGWTREAPAERACAVLPDGVDTNTPESTDVQPYKSKVQEVKL